MMASASTLPLVRTPQRTSARPSLRCSAMIFPPFETIRLSLTGSVPTSAVIPSTTARLDLRASRTSDASTVASFRRPASCKNERKT